MAEAERPMSELYPGGGAVSLSAQSLFDPSKSSTQPTDCRLAAAPGKVSQEELQEAVSEICKAHSESDCSCLRVGGDPGEQEQSQCEHCVPLKASSPPHSLAETHAPSHLHERVVNAINGNSQAGETVQSIEPASLPVHRSHLDTTYIPVVKQGAPQALLRNTCGPDYHGGDKSIQESHSMLACKQPMQLQQCHIITTICRGANSGEGGAQQPHSRCVCVSSAKAEAKMEGVEGKGHLSPKCDKPLCYGSYNYHVNFEDTFAAYCHPQPIPAHPQLLPRVAGIEPSCNIQRAVAPPSATKHLTLPRLISSVSETGLDAKHLLRCCNLNCSYISLLPPGAAPQSQKHFGGEEYCSSPVGHVRSLTHDMGTMTAHKQLRDVGVQTAQTVTPHVFPQICLAEERRREAPDNDSNGGKKAGGAPKSPVKEVKWDAEGMTWEVYGASVDPEELGVAIQKHLELQIKETASHAAKLSHQNTNSSRQGGNTGCQRKRSRMMGSIRAPACCTRSTTAVD
ncbi:uncharacterized protein LOC115020113 [Cottoperca gobio]|uniref:Uncharacterized protein LOC115020113 n=1 Tax=Cottoperca gobio TaxID=56716 RepID=A0A6J2R8Q6_COTGO|nr:uncharacterized protein LOC115020113 [Cottoperca gobio]XP_029305868.1 uncharacterized protein LOC115020113 [Cottoperca gobio]